MGKQMNIQEAAEHLRLSVSTLRKWVMMRKIPFEKMGDAVRFDLEKINVWADEHTVYPEKELAAGELEREQRKHAGKGKREPGLFPEEGTE